MRIAEVLDTEEDLKEIEQNPSNPNTTLSLIM